MTPCEVFISPALAFPDLEIILNVGFMIRNYSCFVLKFPAMSPEFRIEMEMVVDLPSEEDAQNMAGVLKNSLVGLNKVSVERVDYVQPTEVITHEEPQEEVLFPDLSYGQTIRMLRQSQGMVQAELARRSRISIHTLNGVEREKYSHRQRPDSIYRMARQLGFAPDHPVTRELLVKAGYREIVSSKPDVEKVVKAGESSELNFGQSLAHFRTISGLSQRELAKRAGLDVGAISRLERSQRDPRTITLLKITGALGWDVEDPRTKHLLRKLAPKTA